MSKKDKKVQNFNVTIFNVEVKLPTEEVAVSEPIVGFENVLKKLAEMDRQRDENGKKLRKMGDFTIVEL